MLRDTNCGELRRKDLGKTVTIGGWIKKVRDHGEIVFVDLWDRYGKTQIVITNERRDLLKRAKTLGLEWVIIVNGVVRERPKDMVNKEIDTGEIEVLAQDIKIFNKSKVPPFVVEEELKAGEELRYRYRYLDLRREKMLKKFLLRHQVFNIIRNYLGERNFLEVETPILAKSTPEGARDFLVPSRLHRGKFYALAQSPQLYKQILMVSGFDKYYQFAKCLRDEDLRGDRQFEHTQLDIEMSFTDESTMFDLMEGLMSGVFKNVLKLAIRLPFPRMTYEEAMERFGSDKPDLRNPLEIKDYTKVAKSGKFKIMIENPETRGIKVKGFFSRKQIDELEAIAKKGGAGGLLYLINDGRYKGPFIKHFDDLSPFKVQNGETLFLISGGKKIVLESLGVLRKKLGYLLNVVEGGFKFLWVTDFPLFLYNEDEKHIEPCHHIFTQPKEEDMEYLDKDPLKVIGRQYDLVLNGVELASGSIRNHNPELQKKLFKVLGMSNEEIENKFGFLLEALSYGAPPHGGIAMGMDRLCMIMAGSKTIRDVIAFPKTYLGMGLMEGSPSEVGENELKELHIKVVKDE